MFFQGFICSLIFFSLHFFSTITCCSSVYLFPLFVLAGSEWISIGYKHWWGQRVTWPLPMGSQCDRYPNDLRSNSFMEMGFFKVKHRYGSTIYIDSRSFCAVAFCVALVTLEFSHYQKLEALKKFAAQVDWASGVLSEGDSTVLVTSLARSKPCGSFEAKSYDLKYEEQLGLKRPEPLWIKKSKRYAFFSYLLIKGLICPSQMIPVKHLEFRPKCLKIYDCSIRFGLPP